MLADSDHEILQLDALEGLRGLADKSVDLILSDPAYSSLEQWREMGTTTRLKESKGSSNKWFATVDNDYFGPFIKECLRVLKPNTYLMLMGDERTSHIYYATLLASGIKDDRIGFAYWRKCGKPEGPPCTTCGHQPMKPGTRGMGYPYGQVVEKIVLAKKGKPKPPKDRKQRNDLGQFWLEEPILKGGDFYPTEKPTPLLEKLISITDLPSGSFIVDPFAGSGSTGEAAFNLGHRFLGFDLGDAWQRHWSARRARWRTPDGGQVYKPDPSVMGPTVLDFFK